MEEKKVTLSFSKEKCSEYCLQILGKLVVEYRITDEGVYERITCNTEEYSTELMTKRENEEFYKETDLSSLIENDTIDISTRGDRWEGSSLNGKPFGYGYIFDDNGSLHYKGFLIDDQKVCWGTTYHRGCNVIEYSGCYFDGMKHGYGVLFDRKGNLLYNGFFLSDNVDYSKSVKIDSSTMEFGQIHYLIEELRIGSNSMKNKNSAVFMRYPFLKLIDIGDQNYQNTRTFCVIECDSLKTIIIRKWCFTCHNTAFKVISCLCLNSIQIGYHSFQNCSMVIVKNCPFLKSITLGKSVFMGDERLDYNTVIMKYLKSLVSIKSGGGSFIYIHIVELINIPNLMVLKLPNMSNNIGEVKKPFDSVLTCNVKYASAFENNRQLQKFL